jgi:DNA helicase-2/ATP-dependent DNA helicase PcrA
VFPERLQLYYQERAAYLARKPNSEDKLAVLDDQVAAVEACYEEFGATSAEDLCRQIEGIFSDGGASVWLSTIHRAKGLEADRVYILHEEKLPLRWANQTADQETQEWNLRYVALTRSKDTLTFVEEGEANGKSEGAEKPAGNETSGEGAHRDGEARHVQAALAGV